MWEIHSQVDPAAPIGERVAVLTVDERATHIAPVGQYEKNMGARLKGFDDIGSCLVK